MLVDLPLSPSLRDLAREVGVSATTVSKTLTGKPGKLGTSFERQEQIFASARRLGYRHQDTLGVVLAQDPVEAHELDRRCAEAIHSAAARVGLTSRTVIASGTEVPEPVRSGLIGAALFVTHLHQPTVVAMAARGLPCVGVNVDREQAHQAVLCDDYAGAMAAYAHLAAHGADGLIVCLPLIHHPAHRQRIEAAIAFAARRSLPLTLIENHRDFLAAVPVLRQALAAYSRPGIFTIADWYLGVRVLASNGGDDLDRRLIAIKATASPWVRPQVTLDLPLAEMATAAVAMAITSWRHRGTLLPNHVCQPTLTIREPAP